MVSVPVEMPVALVGSLALVLNVPSVADSVQFGPLAVPSLLGCCSAVQVSLALELAATAVGVAVKVTQAGTLVAGQVMFGALPEPRVLIARKMVAARPSKVPAKFGSPPVGVRLLLKAGRLLRM